MLSSPTLLQTHAPRQPTRCTAQSAALECHPAAPNPRSASLTPRCCVRHLPQPPHQLAGWKHTLWWHSNVCEERFQHITSNSPESLTGPRHQVVRDDEGISHSRRNVRHPRHVFIRGDDGAATQGTLESRGVNTRYHDATHLSNTFFPGRQMRSYMLLTTMHQSPELPVSIPDGDMLSGAQHGNSSVAQDPGQAANSSRIDCVTASKSGQVGVDCGFRASYLKAQTTQGWRRQ